MRQISWSIGVAPQVVVSLGAGGVNEGMPTENGWVGDIASSPIPPRVDTGFSTIAASGAPVRRLSR